MIGVLSTLFLLTLPAHADRTAARKHAFIILDASGSMSAQGAALCMGRPCPPGAGGNAPGLRRIDNAKELAFDVAVDYEKRGFELGLIVFSAKNGMCDDIEVVLDFSPSNSPATIKTTLKPIQPLGGTPIAASIAFAGERLKKFTGNENEITVVTDGGETCNGNPQQIAASLHEKFGIKTSMIGIDVFPDVEAQLKAIANAGGGTLQINGSPPNPADVPKEYIPSKVSFDGKDPSGRKIEDKPLANPGDEQFDTKIQFK